MGFSPQFCHHVAVHALHMQAIGNHEFDNGPDNLAAFAAALTTPLIRCVGLCKVAVAAGAWRTWLAACCAQVRMSSCPLTLPLTCATVCAACSCNVDASGHAALAGKVSPYIIKTLPLRCCSVLPGKA